METGLAVILLFLGATIGVGSFILYDNIKNKPKWGKVEYDYNTVDFEESEFEEYEEEEPNPIADKIQRWNSKAVVQEFVAGDCVRIVGQSHEWYVIDDLDDDNYLIYYGYDLNDQKITKVVHATELEYSND